MPEPSSTISRGARELRDVRRARDEDRALGARRVVLGQLADAVEQLGAARVVEVLRRQLLERPREAVEHVVGERALVARPQVGVDRRTARGELDGRACSRLLLSRASRTPQKIWRRCGRSQLRNVGVATRGCVAHEPPRSTRWPLPKKTSEYSR